MGVAMDDEVEMDLDKFNIRRNARVLGVVKDDDDLPMAVFMVNRNNSIGWEVDRVRVSCKPKYREQIAAYLARAMLQDHETAYELLFGNGDAREGYKR